MTVNCYNSTRKAVIIRPFNGPIWSRFSRSYLREPVEIYKDKCDWSVNAGTGFGFM